MRVLVVCSYRDYREDGIAPFIKEQVEAIKQIGSIEFEYFLLRGKGVRGYLREIPRLRKTILVYKPDIIHAHYGLSGLLANIVTRRIPVVTTYHGSDINEAKAKRFSNWTLRLSAWNIFVSSQIKNIATTGDPKHFDVIPCGIELTNDQLQTRSDARKILGWGESEEKVLFAGTYGDVVKGPELAKLAISELIKKGENAELIELKGYTRQQVNQLMCAVDCLLMTSISEGSPQVIKEALACGCPIVSTEVGDVAERIKGVNGCYVVKRREPKEVADALEKAIRFKGRTSGREKVIADGMDNKIIAERIINVYKLVLK